MKVLSTMSKRPVTGTGRGTAAHHMSRALGPFVADPLAKKAAVHPIDIDLKRCRDFARHAGSRAPV